MTVPTLDVESFSIKSWDELLAEGAVVRRRVTSGEVAAALAEAGASDARLDWPLGSGRRSLYRIHDRRCSRHPPSAAICSAC